MKKTVYVKDLCCERCARRLAETLQLNDKILKAKADFKKNRIFVDVSSSLTDEELKELVQAQDQEVISIELRKGIFG
jgi:copper chaperone CopZ